MELKEHFEEVRLLIRRGQAIALQAAYAEQLKVYWQVGLIYTIDCNLRLGASRS